MGHGVVEGVSWREQCSSLHNKIGVGEICFFVNPKGPKSWAIKTQTRHFSRLELLVGL